MTERKLASIRRIADIQPIEGADAIVVATIDGWKVVVKKDEFKVGDLALYLEIDSWVPHELAPFLSKGSEPREYNGVKGERLRTIKLRGQVSQGLLLPITTICDWDDEEQLWEYLDHPEMGGDLGEPQYLEDRVEFSLTLRRVFAEEGDDATEILGIQKWEAPIPAQLQGQAAGTFPTSLIPKTDQERIQNCFGEIQKRAKRFATEKVWNAETQTLEEHPVVVPADFKEPTYEVTMKLDGSSCTIFRWEGELRVCSRNLELKINEENKDNTFVAMALKLADRIVDGCAFQGELIGPGIQGNREGFTEHKFFVFDIFDIQKHEYFDPYSRVVTCDSLGLDHVPILGEDWKAPASVEEGLALAEGPSINHKIREGLVWKCNEDPSFSFKTISNQFLLKGGD
jgi:RNA ligase (TIGR02306 family)